MQVDAIGLQRVGAARRPSDANQQEPLHARSDWPAYADTNSPLRQLGKRSHRRNGDIRFSQHLHRARACGTQTRDGGRWPFPS